MYEYMTNKMIDFNVKIIKDNIIINFECKYN